MNTPSNHLIYGVQPLLEAFEAGKTIEKIFIQRDLTHEKTQEILQFARQRGVPISKVPTQKLERFTRKNHQGVVAFISAVSYSSLENIIAGCYDRGESPFILVLDRITDVRNFGAISRSAECVGVHGLVVPTRNSALLGGDAVRTSAGALNHLDVCRVESLVEAITYLKNSGLKVVGCTEKAAENLYDQSLEAPLAIVMGSEEDGLSPEVMRVCDQLLRIPMKGNVQSLNVSVAAGIFLFEAARQQANQL